MIWNRWTNDIGHCFVISFSVFVLFPSAFGWWMESFVQNIIVIVVLGLTFFFCLARSLLSIWRPEIQYSILGAIRSHVLQLLIDSRTSLPLFKIIFSTNSRFTLSDFLFVGYCVMVSLQMHWHCEPTTHLHIHAHTHTHTKGQVMTQTCAIIRRNL